MKIFTLIASTLLFAAGAAQAEDIRSECSFDYEGSRGQVEFKVMDGVFPEVASSLSLNGTEVPATRETCFKFAPHQPMNGTGGFRCRHDVSESHWLEVYPVFARDGKASEVRIIPWSGTSRDKAEAKPIVYSNQCE